MDALRQSLIWDSANPASASDIRAYLAKHNDPQLAEALRKQPKIAPRAAGKGSDADPDSPELLAQRKDSAEMEEAYRALNAKRLDDAESRFKAILATQPDSARALAGMGYIRMQQSNFGSAVSFLEQAQQNGAKDSGLAPALATAHFWTIMGEASTALNENDLTRAEQQYQAALDLRPNSPEAVEGLGGTLLKAQQNGAAAEVFERLVKEKPASATGWRGLFQSYYNAGDAPQALGIERRLPTTVRSQLMRDPDFLRSLASAYSSVGRDADAQRVLRSALDLPFPANAHGLKVETELQYAALLQQANHLDQAAGLYRQVLAVDPTNAGAWQGLIRVQHALHSDQQAAETIAGMPPAVYDASMHDSGFASTVAAVFQGTNHLDTAQALLERTVAQQVSANQKPSVGLELQLAGIYLARNNTARAYPIYRQVLAENPDRIEAWKGILGALHGAGRDQEALAQAQQIPATVRSQLELDPEYLQTIGAVYNGLGQPQEAALFINRVQQHYAAQNAAAPADIDVQDAWLLFNSGNDTGLYRQLMLLGSRPDLADEQRRTVQTIWTSWAVRRANQAAGTGDQKRSLAILNAAAKAFPNNPGVLRALASGYARAGLPKQAVAIYKTQDMTAATASDYKSAVGAALASNDQKQAETWLRYGLDAYPRDAQMLTLGAKFEQAHGNSGRAADYFRASLAALPPGDPGSELAGELSLPAPAVRLPSATQSQDLATLLGGGAAAATADTASAAAAPAQPDHPYLPSYNNLSGQAPVSMGGQGTSGGQGQTIVPSYMGNPATRPASPASTRPTTLREYVPQATSAQPAPPAAAPALAASLPAILPPPLTPTPRPRLHPDDAGLDVPAAAPGLPAKPLRPLRPLHPAGRQHRLLALARPRPPRHQRLHPRAPAKRSHRRPAHPALPAKRPPTSPAPRPASSPAAPPPTSSSPPRTTPSSPPPTAPPTPSASSTRSPTSPPAPPQAQAPRTAAAPTPRRRAPRSAPPPAPKPPPRHPSATRTSAPRSPARPTRRSAPAPPTARPPPTPTSSPRISHPSAAPTIPPSPPASSPPASPSASRPSASSPRSRPPTAAGSVVRASPATAAAPPASIASSTSKPPSKPPPSSARPFASPSSRAQSFSTPA